MINVAIYARRKSHPLNKNRTFKNPRLNALISF